MACASLSFPSFAVHTPSLCLNCLVEEGTRVQDKAEAKVKQMEARAQEQRAQRQAAEEEWRQQQRERELQRVRVSHPLPRALDGNTRLETPPRPENMTLSKVEVLRKRARLTDGGLKRKVLK
jgi:hypothetical protein